MSNVYQGVGVLFIPNRHNAKFRGSLLKTGVKHRKKLLNSMRKGWRVKTIKVGRYIGNVRNLRISIG